MTQLTMNSDYNVLESIQENLDKLQTLDTKQIVNNYIATCIASIILIKENDPRTMLILRDAKSKHVEHYNDTMSPLNFWGWVVHRSGEDAKLKKLLKPEVQKELATMAGRIFEFNVNAMHVDISEGQFASIDWDSLLEDGLRVMTLRLNARTFKINDLRDALEKWDDLDANDKGTAVTTTFFLLNQADSHSILIPRLRDLSTKILLNANKQQLAEEGEGGEGGGETQPAQTSPATTATTSSDIAPKEFRLFKGKIIRRKKKGFKKSTKFIKKLL